MEPHYHIQTGSQGSPTPSTHGRYAQIRPVQVPDLAFVDAIERDASHLVWSRSRGQARSLEESVSRFWQGCAAAFVVEQRRTGRRCGAVGLYGLDTANGHGWLALLSDRRRLSGATVVEAAALFISYCFRVWPLRKIYAETLGPNLGHFSSAIGSYLRLEMTLPGYSLHNGSKYDKHVLSIDREAWMRIQPEFQGRAVHGIPLAELTDQGSRL